MSRCVNGLLALGVRRRSSSVGERSKRSAHFSVQSDGRKGGFGVGVGKGISVRWGRKSIGNKRASHRKGSLKCLRSEDGRAGRWADGVGGQRLFPLQSRDSGLRVAERNLGSLKRFWNALVAAY